jgi:hypothetical protein
MKNHRGIVAVVIAVSVGLAILLALAFTLGPWTPEPEESIAMEVLALVAAGLGALSVYIGMSVSAPEPREEDPLADWGGPDDESDPEVEAEDVELENEGKG